MVQKLVIEPEAVSLPQQIRNTRFFDPWNTKHIQMSDRERVSKIWNGAEGYCTSTAAAAPPLYKITLLKKAYLRCIRLTTAHRDKIVSLYLQAKNKQYLR